MKIRLIAIILLTSINLMLLLYFQKFRTISEQKINIVNSELSNCKYTVEKIFESRTKVLNDCEIILNDSIRTNLSYLGLENKIIFWHSSLSCNTCVDQEVDFINNIIDKQLRDQIILFADSLNDIQYFRLRRQLNIDYDIVRVTNSFSNIIVDNSEAFYFTIDNRMRLTNIFYPKKINYEQKCKYIESMKIYNLL